MYIGIILRIVISQNSFSENLITFFVIHGSLELLTPDDNDDENLYIFFCLRSIFSSSLFILETRKARRSNYINRFTYLRVIRYGLCRLARRSRSRPAGSQLRVKGERDLIGPSGKSYSD